MFFNMKTIFSERYRKLVGWLIAERKFKKISQVDLAKKLGFPNSTYISKIEQFERRMDVLEYVMICEGIGLDPKDGLETLVTKVTVLAKE